MCKVYKFPNKFKDKEHKKKIKKLNAIVLDQQRCDRVSKAYKELFNRR